MSQHENNYVDARMRLDSAMAEFLNAAEQVGKGAYEIASDVVDSLFDASNGVIKLEDWTVQ